ncbi:MAG: peptidoglycan DD-metalloendopeptidase family protein [Prevotella sp.]|nr:peptidoglycan DD-metalloendopeptidase family protein [Prevotella sp.]
MKKVIMALLALILVLPMGAQTRQKHRQSTNRTTTTTQTNRRAKKSGRAATTTKPQKQNYTTNEIRGLQSQRQQIEQDIRNQQNRLRANKEDVEKRLNNLLVINGEIESKQKDIEGFENDIQKLDGNIEILKSQMATLQEQLKDRQEKYIKSVRYMAKHSSIQEKLMFIFSANSLTQAYRRLRFVQEYADFQRAQGEQVRLKQEEINAKDQQLKVVRNQKNQLLSKGKDAKAELVVKHTEQEKIVEDLKGEQKTIQVIIADQEKKNAQINAEIDRLVAVEVEKARARAAAEAARKAEAAAAKKRAEEDAKRKAAEERAKREEEKRIAAAKAEEARAKAAAEQARREAERRAAAERAAAERRAAAEKAAEEARQKAAAEAAAKRDAENRAKRDAEAKARRDAEAKAKREAEKQARAAAEEARAAEEAARKAAAEQQKAEQAAREAEAARVAAERKAAADAQRREREAAAAAREETKAETMSVVDRQISGSFENNRGRLPMPVTGSYKIVSHFGQYNVEGLSNVQLDNKGINIQCQPGASARSIFDGEVAAVASVAGQLVVMVRHGDFISVYCNLKNVVVRKGQQVTTRQVLGTVGQDNILQFQLRRDIQKLNPEVWLGR